MGKIHVKTRLSLNNKQMILIASFLIYALRIYVHFRETQELSLQVSYTKVSKVLQQTFLLIITQWWTYLKYKKA